jgi:hypothetical protein
MLAITSFAIKPQASFELSYCARVGKGSLPVQRSSLAETNGCFDTPLRLNSASSFRPDLPMTRGVIAWGGALITLKVQDIIERAKK